MKKASCRKFLTRLLTVALLALATGAYRSPALATGENLTAASRMLSDRGGTFRQLRRIAKTMEVEANVDHLLASPLEAFTDSVSAGEAYERFADEMEEVMQEQMMDGNLTYLDIRALSLCGKQLSVMRQMSRHSSFEVPAFIDGQLTAVNVRFAKDKSGRSGAAVRIELSEGRQIRAEFFLKEDKISGIVAASEETLQKQVEGKMSEFHEKLLAETGKMADISIVYSDTLNQAAQASTESNPAEMFKAAKLFIEALNTL